MRMKHLNIKKNTLQNEQLALYFQFDDDKPIESIKCNGKEFTLKMSPDKNSFIIFTDGNKKFKMFIRRYQ